MLLNLPSRLAKFKFIITCKDLCGDYLMLHEKFSVLKITQFNNNNNNKIVHSVFLYETDASFIRSLQKY